MFTSPLFIALGLGGLLAAFAAAPVLIHLINMMRHRRVKWAAMEFLLQSYKKHRNWIWLKQLLLLAMRIPSRSKRNHIISVIESLNVTEPADKTEMYDILRSVAESFPRRGMMVLVSDLLADPEGTIVGEGDFEAQVDQVMTNLKAVLAEANASLEDVVQITMYVVGTENAPKARMNSAKYVAGRPLSLRYISRNSAPATANAGSTGAM